MYFKYFSFDIVYMCWLSSCSVYVLRRYTKYQLHRNCIVAGFSRYRTILFLTARSAHAPHGIKSLIRDWKKSTRTLTAKRKDDNDMRNLVDLLSHSLTFCALWWWWWLGYARLFVVWYVPDVITWLNYQDFSQCQYLACTNWVPNYFLDINDTKNWRWKKCEYFR